MKRFLLQPLLWTLLFSCCKSGLVHAQTDTLRVMAYNVLNYGEYPLCQGPINSYHAYLDTIIRFANPDIVSLEKMGSIPTSPGYDHTAPSGFQDSILKHALNAAYPGRYVNCPFTNYSSASTFSMLFYNQQKLGFTNIVCTYSNDEDVNTYKLYYKDPNLATTHDTTFLYVTVNHDISGSGRATDRGVQIAGEMAQIQSHFTHLANMINMGDFNVRSSYEPCYQTLTAPTDTNFRYFDPPFYPDGIVSYPANWDANPVPFAKYLTTSTRALGNVPNSCGTSGGAKDWYDHIFLSPWIINGANYISYISHSFRVVGNDGNRVGISVNDAPLNTSAPASVINSLFQMSNKYPVMVDLLVTQNTTGVSPVDPEKNPSAVVNQRLPEQYATIVNPSFGNNIVFRFSDGLIGQIVSLDCADMLGRSLMHQSLTIDKEIMQVPNNLLPGIYFIRIASGQNIICQSKLIKS